MAEHIWYVAHCHRCGLDIPFEGRLSRMRWAAEHRRLHPDDPHAITMRLWSSGR